MTRIGIVGTGLMAGGRIKALRESGRATVVGVYSRGHDKAQALAQTCDAKAYAQFEQMLADVDAVVVCTPNPTHAGFARTALGAAKACLVEYPLCLDLAEANALSAQSDKAGSPLMTGNTILHEETFKYILAHKDKLGKTLTAASRVTFRLEEFRDVWYMQPEVRGPFSPSVLYHHTEFFKRIVGPIESTSLYEDSRPDPERPGYCTHIGGTLTMQHPNGAASTTQWYIFGHGSGETRGMWVTGEQQSLSVTFTGDGKHEMRWSDGTIDCVTESDWGIAGSCGDFLDAIEGKLDWRARLSEDIDTLRAALQIPA